MRVLFLLHEQFGDYRTCPAYTEVYQTMIHSGYVKEHKNFIYQKEYRKLKDVSKYIRDELKSIYKKIGEKPILVSPLGYYMKLYFHLFLESGLNIVGIMDESQNIQGSFFYGKKVIGIDEAKKSSSDVILFSERFEDIIEKKFLGDSNNCQVFKLYEALENCKKTLFKKYEDVLDKKLLPLVKEYKPDLIFYTPTWEPENISPDIFYKIRQDNPNTKIVTIWWDHSEEGLREFEKASLKYSDLIIENSNFTRIEKIKRKEGIYADYEDSDKIIFLPTVFNPYLYKKLNLEKRYDISILGSPEGVRKEYIGLLKFFYPGNFYHIGNLQKSQRISTKDYVEAINRTKIFVNTQTFLCRMQLKGKIREALSCGAFVLEQYNKETEAFLPEEGYGVIFFKDHYELMEKIDYYLKNEKEREEIAKRGYEWYSSNFSSKKWVETILKEMKNV